MRAHSAGEQGEWSVNAGKMNGEKVGQVRVEKVGQDDASPDLPQLSRSLQTKVE